MTHFLHLRLQFLMKEARLCAFSPISPPSGPGDTVGGALGDATSWVARNIGGTLLDVPRSFYNSLRRQFGETLSPEYQRQVREIHDFLRDVPAPVAQLITNHMDRLDLNREQILALCRHEKWIKALRDLSAEAPPFGQGQVAVPTATECNSKNILLSATPAERRQIFVEYVRKFFPAALRERSDMVPERNFRSLFFNGTNESGTDATDVSGFSHTFRNANTRRTVLDSMHAMVTGRTVDEAPIAAGTTEGNLATFALRQRYFQTLANGEIVPGRTLNRRVLFNEMLATTLRHSNVLSVADMQGATLEPSFLKGAAALGVLEDRDIEPLRPMITKHRTAITEHTTKTSQRLEEYFRPTEREMRERSDTLTNKFHRLPLLAKILLLFGGFKVMKNNPGPSTAVGSLLFGMYFFGGRNNPIGDAGNFMTSLAGLGSGLIPDLQGLGMPSRPNRINARELQRRSDAFVRFQDQLSQGRLGDSLVLAGVADIELNLLARTYVAPTTSTVGTFNVEDRAFSLASKEALERRNLDRTGISRMFNDSRVIEADAETSDPSETLGQRNRRNMNDAMGNLFYFIASQDPANRTDVNIIESAKASIVGRPQIYRFLPDTFVDPTGRSHNPQQLYRNLIMLGQQRAMNMPGQTLGQYAYGLLGMPTVDEVVEGDRERKLRSETIEAKKKSIHDRQYRGTNTGLRTRSEGDTVVIFLEGDSGTSVYPLSIRSDRFHDLPVEALVQQWVEYGRGQLNAAILAEPALAGLGVRLKTRAAGEDIEISRDILPGPSENRAKAPAYKLFKKTPAEINTAYLAWTNDTSAAAIDSRKIESNKYIF